MSWRRPDDAPHRLVRLSAGRRSQGRTAGRALLRRSVALAGLGPAVAERLESEWADQDVRVLSCQLLTPELAEPVSRAEMVVFIDAAAAGRQGEVSCARVEPDRTRAFSFTHHFDPAGLLALAEVLYGWAPEAYALSVCGQSFECTEGLTGPVAARMPEVAEKARELVRRVLAERP